MNPTLPQPKTPEDGLRRKVLRGGTFLIIRQVLGIAINAVGLMLLLWAIGVANYGLFMAAIAFYHYLFHLSQCGIDVYLIRREGQIPQADYHQAFTMFLVIGVAGAAVALLTLPLLNWWVRMEGFSAVAAALFLGLPLALLNLVPLAHLERNLDYRRIAMIELLSQLIYQLVTLALAFRGWGAFGPICGWWAQHLFCFIVLYTVSGYRPRLHWEWQRIRTICGYGLGFSGSMWIWHLRNMVNPLIIGHWLGAAAVGYAALTIRVLDLLCFVKSIAWRLSISILARVEGDRGRITAAISEGMRLQILSIGLLLAGFGLIAPLALLWLPKAKALEWAPVLQIFPFFALGYLMHALFSLQVSALYVLHRNLTVLIFHTTNLFCFAGAAWLLVPRLGLIGYGWAEVASFGSYAIIWLSTARTIGWVDYLVPGAWVVAFGMVSFWPQLDWFAGLGLLAVAIWPRTWRILGGYIRGLWAAIVAAKSQSAVPATPGVTGT